MTRDAAIIELARKMRGMTQGELAMAAKVSPNTLYRLKTGDERIEEDTLAKVATALSLQFDWSVGKIIQPANITDASIERLTKPRPAKVAETRLVDFQPAGEVPTWDVDVAASEWIDVPICQLDADDPKQRRVIESGRFRLRIRGKCMEPVYPDGCTIEFEILRIDAEGMVPGRDYVVCRSDNTGTFKRLFAADEDSITLAAINQEAHPGVIAVPRQEVARVAKVAWILTPPPEPKIPKIRKAGKR